MNTATIEISNITSTNGTYSFSYVFPEKCEIGVSKCRLAYFSFLESKVDDPCIYLYSNIISPVKKIELRTDLILESCFIICAGPSFDNDYFPLSTISDIIFEFKDKDGIKVIDSRNFRLVFEVEYDTRKIQ